MSRAVRIRFAVVIPLMALLLATACSDDDSDPAGQAEDAAEQVQNGLEAHADGDLEQAEEEYKAALENDPENVFALYNLGLVEQTTDRDVDAEKHYRQVLAINPNFPAALFNLAILRSEASAVDEAVSLYERVITLAPENAGAHLNLGLLLQQLGREDRAQTALSTAVQLDPTLASRVAAANAGEPESPPSSTLPPPAVTTTTEE